ncbi:MAG: rod shape-determining protein, partial [Oscillospiraceae bacterium]|nr:rod shape-determining protein [Oscillospiraceae bacterium]
VPAAITGIESDAVVEAVVAAGARQVFLIDEPLAAALGSDVNIFEPEGRMIVDIGGGTTDIAVISLGGKVRATSVNVAGNTFDEELLKYVRQTFSVAIGLRTVEELKRQVACCRQKDFSASMVIKGRSLLNGLPQKVTVTTEDLYEPVMMLAEQIAAAAHQVLEKTPPELAGDIYRNGVMLTGGGALLQGLPEFLSEKLKVKVYLSPDPINCVALGTARSLAMGSHLETGFLNATPRIGH